MTLIPIKYPGSKANLLDKIYSLIPADHECFVDVFGGSGVVLLNKPPSKVEVYNDIDGDLVALFRVLRDLPDRAKAYLELVPYSRAEYNYYVDMLKNKRYEDEFQHGIAAFVAYNQSYSGNIGKNSWSFSPKYNHTKRYWNKVENIIKTSIRLRNVTIEQADFRDLIQKYDREGTVFYLDPPYITETREEVIYKHEGDDLMHMEIVRILRGIKGFAILSGYEHPIYCPLSEFMDKVEIETRTIMNHKVPKSRRTRSEVLWYSRKNRSLQMSFIIGV